MIEFQQVSKGYGGQTILDDASFRVCAGERAGFVGPNGAGKTTVFALICGEADPDRGRVDLARDTRVGYLRQQIRLDESALTLRAYVERSALDLRTLQAEIHRIEDGLAGASDADARRRMLARLGELQTIFEHRGGYDLHARAAATLCGLGFGADQLDRSLSAFSGGWQMRAELARALVADPDLLLLDEPSNYLDLPAVEWLRRFLEQYRGTLAMISHDRYLLNTLTEVTYEVAGGAVTRYPGPYEWYARERVLRHEQALAATRNQQRRREQVERFIERFRYKNTKSSQVQSRVKMLERMEEVSVPEVIRGRVRFRLPTPPHCGAEAVRLERIGFAYDEGRWVLRGVDLSIACGEKLAIVGSNGMGKTTLLRLLAGHLLPAEGRRVLGHNVVPGYQSQEFAETMNPHLSAIATLKAAAPDASEAEVRTLLGGFGFSGAAAEKSVEVLSGGEKIRLAFARLLIRPPNLLLLDEPTTHLDIEARETLQQALCEYAGTVVLVSHDVEFVRAVAGGVLAMTSPGVRRYLGGYDDYREKADAEASAGSARDAASRAVSPENAREQRRERAEYRREIRERTRHLDKEIAAAERKIAGLETEQAEWIGRLSEPDLPASDRASAGRRLKEIESELSALLEAWESASTRKESILRELESGGRG